MRTGLGGEARGELPSAAAVVAHPPELPSVDLPLGATACGGAQSGYV